MNHISGIMIALALCASAFGQDRMLPHPGAPLTKIQIQELLRAGVDNTRITEAVQKRGIEFYPTDDVLQLLKKAGAQDALLSVLRAATPKPLSRDQLMKSVVRGENVQQLQQLVTEKGIDFTPSERDLDNLRIAGAPEQLLEAIRTARKWKPPPPSEGPLCRPSLDAHTSASNAVDGNTKPPIPIFKPEPPYSEEARKAKHEGTVVLWITVDAEGNVTAPCVVEPLGLGLDEKAVETVRTWKFTPASRAGIAVPARVMERVDFKLFH